MLAVCHVSMAHQASTAAEWQAFSLLPSPTAHKLVQSHLLFTKLDVSYALHDTVGEGEGTPAAWRDAARHRRNADGLLRKA